PRSGRRRWVGVRRPGGAGRKPEEARGGGPGGDRHETEELAGGSQGLVLHEEAAEALGEVAESPARAGRGPRARPEEGDDGELEERQEDGEAREGGDEPGARAGGERRPGAEGERG